MGGMNRPVSGPDPQPKPATSNSNVKTMNFWYTIGCVHHSPMRPSPPRPGVSEMIAAGTARYRAILRRYSRYTAYGVPKPCSAQCRVTTCNRVARGRVGQDSGSTSGSSGVRNPISADGEPCAPRVCRNGGRGAPGKSSLQVFDQAVESLPVLLFGVSRARKAGGAFEVALGFTQGDRLPVLLDPMVEEAAALGEQTQKVVGLALISRFGRDRTGIEITSRPVHDPCRRGRRSTGISAFGADGVARGVTGAWLISAIRPARARACSTLVEHPNPAHVVSLNRRFSVWRG